MPLCCKESVTILFPPSTDSLAWTRPDNNRAKRTSVKMEEKYDAPSMVVVMGVTGAGKSYFINQLAGKQVVQEGSYLDSCK